VIAVDCSMAHNVGARRACPPAKDTADALRKVLLQEWLGLPVLPSFVVVSTPAQMADTWVLVALDPPYSGVGPIECDGRVEQEFVARHLLRKKDGEVKKPEARYRPLAAAMARRLDHVCASCAEAARFLADLKIATAAAPAAHTAP
jgi:hypothetical protein